MIEETLIINKTFDLLAMMGNTGMLWWMSGIVFCVSLIKMYLGLVENEDINEYYLKMITIFITMFLCSTVVFGLVMVYQTDLLFLNISHLASNYHMYEPLFGVVNKGFLMGTSSFFLILMSWLFMLTGKFSKYSKENEENE
jgi:hypothetical protein